MGKEQGPLLGNTQAVRHRTTDVPAVAAQQGQKKHFVDNGATDEQRKGGKREEGKENNIGKEKGSVGVPLP